MTHVWVVDALVPGRGFRADAATGPQNRAILIADGGNLEPSGPRTFSVRGRVRPVGREEVEGRD